MQQDNDPKLSSKSTTEWRQQKKIRLLEWPSQSPDLNPIEMLWHDLKRAVHTRHPKNFAELKQFSNEEWSKIPPDRCAGLITTAENIWLRLLLPKEGQPVIKSKGSLTFPTLHCECLHSVFSKDIKTYHCLCVISLSRLCLSIVVTQMIRSNVMTNLCRIPDNSKGFTYFFLPLYIVIMMCIYDCVCVCV